MNTQPGGPLSIECPEARLETPQSEVPESRSRCSRGVARAWVLVVLFALPVVIPTLTRPVEDRATDIAAYHFYRSILFSQATESGWLYPRWADALNGGLGSPLFNYYAPAPYFAVDVLHRLGLGYILAWRALLALAALAAATGAFALALAIGRNTGLALLCATLYVYSPALLRDLWQRGSPQGLVFALLPWTLLALHRLLERPSGIRLALAAGMVSLLVLTHNLSAALALPVFVLLMPVYWLRRGPAVRGLFVAWTLGALLAAVHIGPFLLERGYVQLASATARLEARPAEHGLELDDLGWLPAIPDAGIPNLSQMNLAQVDLTQVAALALAVTVTFTHRRQARGPRQITVSAAATLAVVVILLQLDLATPVWRLAALNALQFRWRLLSLVAPALLLALCACPWPVGADHPRLWLALSLLVLGWSLPRLYPELLPLLTHVRGDATPAEITQIAFETGAYDLSTGEFQPIWRQWGYGEDEVKWASLTPIANLPEGARWLSDERTPRSRKTRFVSPVPFEASLHLLYYPGWEVTVDGVPAAPYPSEGGGYLTVSVPAGEHEIVAFYGGTPVQHASAAISLLAAALCVALALLWRPHVGPPPEIGMLGTAPGWRATAAVALVVAVKLLWIDPHTTWFRHVSTREAIHGATQQVNVSFDDSIWLHGYRIEATALSPGDELEVTLYWSADGFPDKEYPGSFVHLLGNTFNEPRGDYLWGQSDHQHRPGRWEQGKLFAETHTVPVDPAAPPGSYSLEIGWWWPNTGQQFQAEISAGPPELVVAKPGYLILKGFEVAPKETNAPHLFAEARTGMMRP